MKKIAIKFGQTPGGNNIYKMIPPFLNTATSFRKGGKMEEYLVVIPVKDNNPPMTSLSTTDKYMKQYHHLMTSRGIKSDAEVLKKLFGYELLDTKPETGEIFGDMLSEL